MFRSQGGVKISSGNGRITLDNTMEERLRLLEDKVFSFLISKEPLKPSYCRRCFLKSGRIFSARTRTVNSTHNLLSNDGIFDGCLYYCILFQYKFSALLLFPREKSCCVQYWEVGYGKELLRGIAYSNQK